MNVFISKPRNQLITGSTTIILIITIIFLSVIINHANCKINYKDSLDRKFVQSDQFVGSLNQHHQRSTARSGSSSPASNALINKARYLINYDNLPSRSRSNSAISSSARAFRGRPVARSLRSTKRKSSGRSANRKSKVNRMRQLQKVSGGRKLSAAPSRIKRSIAGTSKRGFEELFKLPEIGSEKKEAPKCDCSRQQDPISAEELSNTEADLKKRKQPKVRALDDALANGKISIDRERVSLDAAPKLKVSANDNGKDEQWKGEAALGNEKASLEGPQLPKSVPITTDLSEEAGQLKEDASSEIGSIVDENKEGLSKPIVGKKDRSLEPVVDKVEGSWEKKTDLRDDLTEKKDKLAEETEKRGSLEGKKESLPVPIADKVEGGWESKTDLREELAEKRDKLTEETEKRGSLEGKKESLPVPIADKVEGGWESKKGTTSDGLAEKKSDGKQAALDVPTKTEKEKEAEKKELDILLELLLSKKLDSLKSALEKKKASLLNQGKKKGLVLRKKGEQKSGSYINNGAGYRTGGLPGGCGQRAVDLSLTLKRLYHRLDTFRTVFLKKNNISDKTRDIISRRLSKIQAAIDEAIKAEKLSNLRVLQESSRFAVSETITLTKVLTLKKLDYSDTSLDWTANRSRRAYINFRKACANEY